MKLILYVSPKFPIQITDDYSARRKWEKYSHLCTFHVYSQNYGHKYVYNSFIFVFSADHCKK